MINEKVEPYFFKPFIADLLSRSGPDNEETRAYKERQKEIQKLTNNDLKRKSLIKELGQGKDLHSLISSEDLDD